MPGATPSSFRLDTVWSHEVTLWCLTPGEHQRNSCNGIWCREKAWGPAWWHLMLRKSLKFGLRGPWCQGSDSWWRNWALNLVATCEDSKWGQIIRSRDLQSDHVTHSHRSSRSTAPQVRRPSKAANTVHKQSLPLDRAYWALFIDIKFMKYEYIHQGAGDIVQTSLRTMMTDVHLGSASREQLLRSGMRARRSGDTGDAGGQVIDDDSHQISLMSPAPKGIYLGVSRVLSGVCGKWAFWGN